MGLIDVDNILKEEIGREETLDKRLIERTREAIYHSNNGSLILVLTILSSIFVSIEIILCAAAFEIGIIIGIIFCFMFTFSLAANIIIIYFYKDDILNFIYLGGE
ncbi:MAG: hypothetical protein WCQ54_02700 [Clostridiaceae bacterium]